MRRWFGLDATYGLSPGTGSTPPHLEEHTMTSTPTVSKIQRHKPVWCSAPRRDARSLHVQLRLSARPAMCAAPMATAARSVSAFRRHGGWWTEILKAGPSLDRHRTKGRGHRRGCVGAGHTVSAREASFERRCTGTRLLLSRAQRPATARDVHPASLMLHAGARLFNRRSSRSASL